MIISNYRKLQKMRESIINELTLKFSTLSISDVLIIAEYRLQTTLLAGLDETAVEKDRKKQ